jgi:hypothetical protein
MDSDVDIEVLCCTVKIENPLELLHKYKLPVSHFHAKTGIALLTTRISVSPLSPNWKDNAETNRQKCERMEKVALGSTKQDVLDNVGHIRCLYPASRVNTLVL